MGAAIQVVIFPDLRATFVGSVVRWVADVPFGELITVNGILCRVTAKYWREADEDDEDPEMGIRRGDELVSIELTAVSEPGESG